MTRVGAIADASQEEGIKRTLLTVPLNTFSALLKYKMKSFTLQKPVNKSRLTPIRKNKKSGILQNNYWQLKMRKKKVLR